MLNYLMIILLIQHSQGLHPHSALYQEVFTYHNETALKADFAFEVVEKIYNAFRQWFFTIIFCEFTYFENRILKYTETKDYGFPVVLLNSCPSNDRRKVKPKIDRHGATTYVITSSELTLDMNEMVIEALKKTGVFKPRNPVVFVINVPVDVDSYFYFAMQRHFQLLWSRKITNSILIIWSDKLRMYAYNPFFDVVYEINSNDSQPKVLLARQYNDMCGQVLRVSVFRKIYLSDETGPVKCNTRLIKTVMQRLNATCLPLAPRDGSTVGDLLDNGTATGVTKDLLDGYTDLELNSRILKNSYYGYIDTTYPLFQDELCFLVKKSERQSSFSTTIKLISGKMLIVLFFNVFFLITVGVLTRKLEAKALDLRSRRATSTIIDLIKCFLRQTIDITFMGPAFRTVSLMIMIYSLIIDCVMDSIIISAITYPRYKSDINTMTDLFHSNLTFAIHNRHLQLFQSSMPEATYKLVEPRIKVFNDKQIKRVIETRDFRYAILLRKSDSVFITKRSANLKNGRPIFHTVQECPIPCSMVYGLKYGSPYLPRLNSILYYLSQGGILQHWTDNEQETSSSNLGRILSSEEEGKERRSLSIENLREVFFVWLIGLFISALTLACEKLYQAFVDRLWLV